MFKKMGSFIVAMLAICPLFLGLASTATAQTQYLDVHYNDNVVLSGKGADAVKYRGTVHVQLYAVSLELKAKYGEDPVGSEDLKVGTYHRFLLPFGRYEVHFSMRDGDELRTTIKPAVVRADGQSSVEVDFSPSKTFIYGGDMTAQQMADSIRQLQKEVADLKQQIAKQKQ